MTTGTTLGVIVFGMAGAVTLYAYLTRRDRKKKKRLLKDYDESKDASKQGEEHRKRLLAEGDRADSGREPTLSDIERVGKPKVLPLPPSDSSRENSDSQRETSRRPRGIFRTLRRRH